MDKKKLLIVLAVCFLAVAFSSPINRGDKREKGVKRLAEIPPPEMASVVVNSETTKPDEKTTKERDDEEVKRNCQHADYRSYVQCLLGELKREKRQGYQQQQQCSGSGSGCSGTPVTQPQFCTGSGCPRTNYQQQQCIGNGCGQTSYHNSQRPCPANGCVFFGYNCGAGSECTQIGKNCYGVGCVPPCNGSPCINPPVPTTKAVEGEFGKEIEKIRKELGLVRAQNEKLIRTTEEATSFLVQLLRRPIPTNETKILREPVLVGHNSTTNIDISNYLNNTNVVNVPVAKTDVVKDDDTICCVVVRPRTCRRTSRPPHFTCGHKKHRTCGSHCSKNRVVYSHVKSGCPRDGDEYCVTYHPHPFNPTSGYYPAPPTYYPTFPALYYPIYSPPLMPIYAAPPVYLTDDTEEVEEVEDCEDCESEGDRTEDCEETDCKPARKRARDLGERNNESESRNAGDRTGLRPPRHIPLDEILRVKKEAEAIKKSEDQLTASINMLEEAVELKKLDEEQDKKKVSGVGEKLQNLSFAAGATAVRSILATKTTK